MTKRRRDGAALDQNMARKPDPQSVVGGLLDDVVKRGYPPLQPPPRTWDAFELFMNRAGRVGLAALVPLVGVVFALPRALVLQHSTPLCLRPGMYHPRGILISCSGEPLVTVDYCLRAYWYHFAFAIWVSIQFVYNFAAASFCEPGYAIPASSGTGHFPVIGRRANGDLMNLSFFVPRWCAFCRSWKPPRAHHSTKVGCCVFRMDHYCITVENIVGARNHGYFVLMVAFGGCGLLYGLVMAGFTVYQAWIPFW